MNITPTQKLAWFYAVMFVVLGSLSYIPWINDENGVTLGIFSLQWYDNLLHYASGAWAAVAAWKSFKASEFYFKLFGLIYGLDGVMGLLTGQGYLDGGIFINGITPLDWGFKIAANIPHILIGGIAVVLGFVFAKRFARDV
jgi:hypothetical protein